MQRLLLLSALERNEPRWRLWMNLTKLPLERLRLIVACS